jgi:uncharacterized protein (DUF1330 family)
VAAYLIADLEITDAATMAEYRKAVVPTFEKYGAKVIAGLGRFEVLEGSWNPKSTVIIEFPSYERLKEWYACDEYKAVKPLRERSAKSNIVITEGV